MENEFTVAFLMGFAPLPMAMARGTSMSRHNMAMRTLVSTTYGELNEQK
jgi:hypothetical protein